jgi:hypothetical protein
MPQTTWDEIEERKEGSGSKMFLRLKDGEFVEGIFAGQPFKLYNDFKKKEYYDTWAEGRNTRYRINFIVGDEAKIFETSFTTMSTIKAMVNEYGQDYVYKIKRSGSSKDNTVYHVLPKEKLAPTALKIIKDIKLNNLKPTSKSKQEPAPSDEDRIPDDNLDF